MSLDAWLTRGFLMLTVLFAPALALAAQANPGGPRRWDWGFLWIVVVGIVIALLFSSMRSRGRPPTARGPRV